MDADKRGWLVVVILAGLPCQSAVADEHASAKQLVLPNPSVLGQEIGSVMALAKPRNKDAKALIYPTNIQFDLDGSNVYGLIATYSDDVDFDRLVAAVNRTQKKWWRDSDGKMAEHGVTVWRNEQDRFAAQVTDNQLIMIWLDRRITDAEEEQWGGAITEATKNDAIRASKDLRHGDNAPEM